jgi:tRNA pseudouridine32 synthase/23S rRNA pseudouridine746 synthase
MTEKDTLRILFEDESLIVVEKTSGMPSVPGLDGRNSLQELLTSQSNEIHAVHRLDMDTSGVMVFAKTSEAAVNLRRQFEEHTIRKTYMARVSADTDIPSKTGKGTIDLPLSPDYDERPRQKIDFRQGKPAYTEYEIIRNHEDGTADLLLYPHTGRTHQLRVHCAHHLGLGRPIVGDLLYGGHSVYDCNTDNRMATSTKGVPGRLCLHALSITFRHPLTAEELTFTSDKLSY